MTQRESEQSLRIRNEISLVYLYSPTSFSNALGGERKEVAGEKFSPAITQHLVVKKQSALPHSYTSSAPAEEYNLRALLRGETKLFFRGRACVRRHRLDR